MDGTTLPRVIIADVHPHAGLARAVERCLGSCCRVLREETISVSASPGKAAGASQPVDWREKGIAGAIVCASNIHPQTGSPIALKLSQLRELPLLVVTDASDAMALSWLVRSGADDFVTSPVREPEIVARMERLLLSPRDPFGELLHLLFRQTKGNADEERTLMSLIAEITADSHHPTELESGEPIVLRRVLLSRMAFLLTAVPLPGMRLTRRENAVGRLVGHERGNRGIAEELGIAQSTVEKHLINVFTKLGVSTRAALARRMALLDLVFHEKRRDLQA